MNLPHGFVDLRPHHQQAEHNDSFWPSFTDIMMVIVMIFLLAMVVLLVRNMELVDQLRATMEAERKAAELAKTTGLEKDSLQTRLLHTQDDLSMARLEMMRMSELLDQRNLELQRQQTEIARLIREQRQWSDSRQLMERQLEERQQALARSQQDVQQLRSDRDQAEQRLVKLSGLQQLAQAELTSLRQQLDLRDAELARQQQQQRQISAALQQLEGEHYALRVKYDRLVRPARTAQGKHVIEVRHYKEGDVARIEIKEPSAVSFRRIGAGELDSRLKELSAEYPDKLYIRVIFPEDSGLSYNEAWRFTSHLHQNYDYYYREQEATDPTNAVQQDQATEADNRPTEIEPTGGDAPQ
jgi:DNA repair exonuclease SbcCD ATPase subunit